MTKFKVGDKVRILDVDSIWLGDNIEIINGAATVEEVNSSGRPRLKCVSGMPLIISAREMQYIEKLPQSPTKNQRITTLESEVAELKAKVEALEEAQQPRRCERGVRYEMPIQTPNRKRKAIIAEAKAFVATKTHYLQDSPKVKGGWAAKERENPNFCDYLTKAEFIVNTEKRTVVALIRYEHGSDLKAKGIAKCAPDDVFNADIGKAIALGRALGLDVSRFEQAVKPTEVVVGMKVTACFDGKTEEYTARNVYKEGGEVRVNPKEVMFGYYPYEPRVGDRIIDDTEAVY